MKIKFIPGKLFKVGLPASTYIEMIYIIQNPKAKKLKILGSIENDSVVVWLGSHKFIAETEPYHKILYRDVVGWISPYCKFTPVELLKDQMPTLTEPIKGNLYRVRFNKKYNFIYMVINPLSENVKSVAILKLNDVVTWLESINLYHKVLFKDCVGWISLGCDLELVDFEPSTLILDS